MPTLIALLALAAAAQAQRGFIQSPGFHETPPALPDSEHARSLPADAYDSPPELGVPTHDLFRTSRLLPIPETSALAPEPHLGADSVQGMFRLEIPTLNGNFPLLHRGIEPQNADIKLGPVFFKLNAVSAGLLFSDNANLTETDRESGAIAILRLSGTLVVQFSEDVRFAASGSLVYLPTEGEIGFGSAASRIPYSLGLTAIPALLTQFTWDTQLFGQPILIADELSTRVGHYSSSTRDDFYAFEEGSTGEARLGRYTFRLPPQTANNNHQDQRTEQSSDFTVISNEISASADRLLPGDIRLHVRVFNENLWYNQGNRGLPTLRDGASVLLQEVHEDWRFKPFLSYDLLYTDITDSFNHTILLGITGPITDQLHFLGDAGVFYYTANDSAHFLFHLDLRHIAGPYTRESLFVGRTVNDFQDEITTEATYSLRQVLGPKLDGTLFASYAYVEDLLNQYSARDEYRVGLRFQYQLGPRTSLSAAGIYAKIVHDPFNDANSDTWTARVDLVHRFSDTIYGRLLYQYQVRDSTAPNDSYYENLVYLSLTKFFR